MEGNNGPVLEVQGISKRFGATQALSDVSFDVRAGEVHALVGENGAGKSTLMKIISGNYVPDAGQLRIDGSPVAFSTPQEARAAGVAIIHQELNSLLDMTVAENLALGSEPRTRLGFLDRARMRRDAAEKLASVGSRLSPDMPMRRLSVGMQQVVEIARAVSEEARILVLDEPTAALSKAESEELFSLIEQMRAGGTALIYISHRMEEVWRLADRVSVFRDGCYVGTRDKQEVRPDEIVHMMVGRDLDDLYSSRDREPGEVTLSVEGLVSPSGAIGPISFDVRAGEVVGMVGLIGAGRTEVARMIYGAERPGAGTILLGGKRHVPRTPERSIAAGIAMLPEDRKDQALFLDMSVTDNVTASTLSRWTSGPLLLPGTVAKSASDLTSQLHLKAASGQTRVRSLSGGNQQKVVLARMLMQEPQLLILDEPTRSVDIGAKGEIYRIIDRVAASGTAVLLISSDLPEALGISDRLLVMRERELMAELDAASATEASVMEYATGVMSEATNQSEDSDE